MFEISSFHSCEACGLRRYDTWVFTNISETLLSPASGWKKKTGSCCSEMWMNTYQTTLVKTTNSAA
jgi:hypothetical protein